MPRLAQPVFELDDFGRTLPGSARYDAFLRQRVSNPETRFDGQHQYKVDTTLVWDTGLSVSGTATHLPNESAVSLSTAAGTSGNSAILQTKNYYRYQPGKAQEIEMTFVLGAAVANVKRRVGYFDVNNGVFLEQNGTTDVALVVRSKASGSVVDTRITQANWNQDRLDGTGPSGIVLDLSKVQIFYMDLQWLGVGSVSYGFVINKRLVLVHIQHHANSNTTVYMTTANLPIRYEIVNAAAVGGANTMKAICATVISSGGIEDERFPRFAIGNGTSLLSTTTRRPILSIQVATTFNSIEFRGLVRPLAWDPYADANAYFEIVLNGALTGASFAAVDATSSAVNYDVSATAITGGTVVDCHYLSTGGGVARSSDELGLDGRLAMCLNAAGSTGDILTVCATRQAGTTNCGAVIRWSEEK